MVNPTDEMLIKDNEPCKVKTCEKCKDKRCHKCKGKTLQKCEDETCEECKVEACNICSEFRNSIYGTCAEPEKIHSNLAAVRRLTDAVVLAYKKSKSAEMDSVTKRSLKYYAHLVNVKLGVKDEKGMVEWEAELKKQEMKYDKAQEKQERREKKASHAAKKREKKEAQPIKG